MSAMVSDGALQAMRRKAGEGRSTPEAGQMSPARAWQAALPKAAEECAGLVLSVRGVTERRAPRDDVAGDMAEGALLALLEGPSERFGIAVLDPQVLAGLIEVLTTGRVIPRPAEPRVPTRTDAVMCADLLDRLLELFEQALGEMEAPPDLGGYRYATQLADPRLVEMTLAEGAYRVFTCAVDLGRGAKQGEVRIALPDAGSARPGPERERQFQRALEERVLDVPAQIDAVLHRFRLTLDDVMALRPGDVLPVPAEALKRVSLEARTRESVATARLGQLGGARAVRVLQAHADEDEPEGFDPAAPGSDRSAAPLPGPDAATPEGPPEKPPSRPG